MVATTDFAGTTSYVEIGFDASVLQPVLSDGHISSDSGLAITRIFSS